MSGASPYSDNEYKCTMVDVSVDTFTSIVDNNTPAHNQDSGSNQSGSDSGVGYTNSLSSDNSSFNTAIHHQDRKNTAKKDFNNNSKNFTCSGNAIIKSNHHNGSLNTDCNGNRTDRNNNNSSCNINSSASSSPKSGLKIINETRIIHHETKSKHFPSSSKSNATATLQYPNDEKNQLLPSLPLPPPPLPSDLSTSSPTSPHPPGVPVSKSLLKKPSSNLHGAPRKHDRHVSFNQTVIVFCEGFGAPSPNFEPPLDYQDHSNLADTFEPPEDYCDPKQVGASNLGVTYEDAGSDPDHIVEDKASNLTDEQLMGLLENESLLENFKIDCDDYLEDDFPTNYLDSNHSYLGSNAISDSDTESETSLVIESKELCCPQSDQVHHLDQPQYISQPCPKSCASQKRPNIVRETPTIQLPENEENLSQISVSSDFKIGKPITSKQNPQKSLPARVRVSTLDNSHSKRQTSKIKDSNAQKVLEKQQSTSTGTKHDYGLEKNLPTRPANKNEGRVVVTQSVVEPITIAKPTFVSTNPELSKVVPTSRVVLDQRVFSTNRPPSAQSSNISNQQIRASGLPSTSPSTVHQTTKSFTNQTSNTQSCQICRVIESKKSSAYSGNLENLESRDDPIINIPCSDQQNALSHQVNQLPSSVKSMANHPAFNQSCASCREASKQNLIERVAQVPVTGSAQAYRSLPCQIVYVVDQNGNRTRALSVIRPPNNFRHDSQFQNPLVAQRAINVSGNIQFANPSSFVGHFVNTTNQASITRPSLPSNANVQYKIVAAPPQLSYPQRNIIVQNPNINLKTSLSNQRDPMEGVNVPKHTIYYVRQPLGAQSIQMVDSSRPNSRSFPDPHEIRRLDGLRGPAGLSLSNKNEQLPNANQDSLASSEGMYGNEKRDVQSSRDDVDDPTFGFSKRPSVKVVANNFSHVSQTNHISLRPRSDSCGSGANQHAITSSNNMYALRQNPVQAGNVRPVSVILLGSQTLDRRHYEQRFPESKENIPSTSSMSNIHGTFIDHSHTNTNQQPRISSKVTQDLSNDLTKAKDAKLEYCQFKLDGSSTVNNTGVIENCEAISLTAHGRQTSSLNEQIIATKHPQRAQDKSEVLYSMNV